MQTLLIIYLVGSFFCLFSLEYSERGLQGVEDLAERIFLWPLPLFRAVKDFVIKNK